MAMESSVKDFAELSDALLEQGWTLEKTADNHTKAYPPDKTKSLVVYSSKSGDFRAIRNTISQLRRSGFMWPPREGVEVTAPPKPDPLAQRVVQEVVEQAVEDLFPVSVMNEELDDFVEQHPPAPSSQPDSLEALFRELKEAKQSVMLSVELVEHCQDALTKAEKDLGDAVVERERAMERMRKAKSAFDKEFGS